MTLSGFKAKFTAWIGDHINLKALLAELAGLTFEKSSLNTLALSDNKTISEDEMGAVVTMATDAKVITLPKISAAILGKELTFINTGADGNNTLTLSPDAADGINGTIANAAADSVASGVVNKDLVNTKATANKGDYVRIRAVALTAWYIVGGVGIWASEA